MEYRQYIDFLHKIEKLKCHTRHSWNSEGKRESVAEHSWRLSVMALLCADEYPELDMVKVLKMCLIHDFGEAVTGDIPSFYKTADHEETEAKAVRELVSITLRFISPDRKKRQMRAKIWRPETGSKRNWRNKKTNMQEIMIIDQEENKNE